MDKSGYRETSLIELEKYARDAILLQISIYDSKYITQPLF